jgi:hypothetical protein
MAGTLEFTLDDGGTLVVESLERDTIPDFPGASRPSRGLTFSSALKRLPPIVNSIVDQINLVRDKPNEISVELAIKMDASTGIVVAPLASSPHFRITLKWTLPSS